MPSVKKPTIVVLTMHATVGAMLERHCEGFAVITVLSDIAEFERRALKLRPRILVLDEAAVADAAVDVGRLRKNATMKAMKIVVLCKYATPPQVAGLHDAGADDIILTTHHAPRDIAARLSSMLSL